LETPPPLLKALPPIDASRSDMANIAHRAYELFELRGRGDGGHLEDWLHAEREIRLMHTIVGD
jgi:hypothetical protein